MMEQIENLVWSIRFWIQNQYHDRGGDSKQRGVVRYAMLFVLLPILISFIFVQMQQQAEINNNSIGICGFLWNSTALGAASLILSIWHFALRVVGVSLGIGLGLGFAGHVYDALSDAKDDNSDDMDGMFAAGRPRRRRSSITIQRESTSSMPNFVPKDATKTTSGIEDVNSYHSLMRSAGYSVDNGTLRAQMIRGSQATNAMGANDAKRELMQCKQQQLYHPELPVQPIQQNPRMSAYKFDQGTTAAMRMKGMWPNLANVINESLAKLTEFVLRDYVSSWYSKVDEHVVYTDPEIVLRSSESSTDLSAVNSAGADKTASMPVVGEGERRNTISNPSEVNATAKKANDYFRIHSDGSEPQQRPNINTPPHHTNSAPLPRTIQQQQNNNIQRQQSQARTMILTTTGTQHSPFIDSLYSCFAYLLGMLATRASENVNILELLLLHFPHILGQNLRIYRQMRNAALEKKRRRVAAEREKWRKKGMQESSNNSDIGGSGREGQFSPTSFERSGSFAAPSSGEGEVSEIAIVREYLLAGRFHRAVTFGLDVPSLLFADPLGKECLPGPSYRGNTDIDRLNGHPDEDAILDDRLLSPESTLIEECELDYSRVLASKLTKLAVPKNEVESSIVKTMLVEMLASCVLGPIMGCFCPDSVNGWVITGLGLLEGTNAEESESTAAAGSGDGMTRVNSDLEANHHSASDDANSRSKLSASVCSASVVTEQDDFLDSIVEGVMDDIASQGSIASDMDDSLFGMDEESARKKAMFDLGNCSRAEQIITMLSMSIIELGSFVDFEDCRYAREHGQDCVIDWDAHRCRESVRHLVLVIEAALLLGVRSHPKRQKKPNDRAFSEFEIEATLDEGPEDRDEFEVDIDDGIVEEPKVKSTVCHKHASLSAALVGASLFNMCTVQPRWLLLSNCCLFLTDGVDWRHNEF